MKTLISARHPTTNRPQPASTNRPLKPSHTKTNQGKRLVFLLSDGQLKEDGWLEDVNKLLNAGEVPNMFPQDERMQVRCFGCM
jgi:hypothetical protein